jgi:hypothetical protein
VDEFVKKCRREWKRLRVPDAVANEMAADLEADLNEAEAEGASAEDVLGSGIFDARLFAASWAAERGVIPPPASKPRLPWRSPMLAAIIALTAIAAVGLGMVIASRVGGPRSVTVAAGPPFAYVRPDLRDCPPFAPPYPPPPNVRACVAQREVIGGQTIIGPPRGAFREVLAAMPRSRLFSVGWILIIVGVAGLILLLLVARFGPWSQRRARVEEPESGSDWT